MPALTFDKLRKSYGDNAVIREFDATVPDQEFLVLLGPSGCGKSTMLRMIAGLTDVTGGRVLFDDEDVTSLSPKDRNIAFVFQSYALYPHQTVRANIAFPLLMDRFRWWHHLPLVGMVTRRAALRDPELRRRVEEVAETLELTSYLDRRPKALSGGQRQRVAVARALVREPSVYLLDEPLSNLDAKLRTQMRAEITALYQRVRKTFVYVTHDQVEAMTMGTRIMVLNDGVVQQYGTPAEIYERPANTFVAGFIGAPPMNLIGVRREGDTVTMAGRSVQLPDAPDGDSTVGVRPETLTLLPQGQGRIEARVAVVEHLGAESVVGLQLGDDAAGPQEAIGGAASRGLRYARVSGSCPWVAGDVCGLDFDPASASWFDGATGERIESLDPAPV